MFQKLICARIFTALTPFPETEIYAGAKGAGWIEDFDLSHYYMDHEITSRKCYHACMQRCRKNCPNASEVGVSSNQERSQKPRDQRHRGLLELFNTDN